MMADTQVPQLATGGVEVETAKYVGVQEIADELGMDIQTIRRWIHTGKLPATKPGLKYLVAREELDAFLEERATGLKGGAPRSEAVEGRREKGVRVTAEGLEAAREEHASLNAALNAEQITPEFYTAKIAKLYLHHETAKEIERIALGEVG